MGNFELFEKILFPSKYSDILNRINSFKPIKYGASRNYVNGSVSYLSAYISRGVISTKFILKTLLDKNYNPADIEKFIQETCMERLLATNLGFKGKTYQFRFKEQSISCF